MSRTKPLLIRVVATLSVVTLLVAFNLIHSAASSQDLTFTPTSDAYVNAGSPSANYGTITSLRVDGSPVVNSYLRFTVSGLAGQAVSQASLRIYANSASSQGAEAYAVSNNSWSETGITYSNAPAFGSKLASASAVASGSWVTFDVTSYVTCDGDYDFGVSTPGSTAISLAARESGAHAPQLLITINGAASSTATQTLDGPTPTNANPPTETQTITLVPNLDAYVNAGSPSSNYGTLSTLRMDGSPVVDSYLRFTVSGLSGQVSQASLRIYANSASSQGAEAYAVSNNAWNETSINYSNAPAFGSKLDSASTVTKNNWITFDVSSYVTGNGDYNFGVSTSGSTAVSLAARESGVNAPQLVITYGGSSTPVPPSPTPTVTRTPAGSTPTATHTPANSTPTRTSTPGAGQSQNVTPVADAYVNAGSPSSNYSTSTTLRVDASPVVNSYLRFSLSGTGGQVTQATLRIYANSSSSQGAEAYAVSNNSWNETSINYSNAPTFGSKLASASTVAGGTWITFDVSSYVTGDGDYSFGVLTPGSTAVSLAARESGANAPQLVVTVNGAPASTATRTPTPASGSTPTATQSSGGATATSTSVSTGNCSAIILTKGPTLIYTGDNTKMRVFWQWSSNTTFQMQWGTNTSYSQGNLSVNPNDTTNHLYTYDISGLTPSTKYYYRVVIGSQCASGTFYAAPASNATSIKFFSYGDTRSNGSEHNKLAGLINSVFQSDPAFQTINLNVGDWVSGDSESAWTSEWFATSFTNLRTQDANIADIGVRGNHEGGATYWKRYWPEPFQSGGLYWSFDYGPIHVAMLDQYASYTPGSAQYNWLQADLAASNKPWKFIVLHEPGWSSGGGHANNTSVQNNIQPLCVQYGVSIVFGGHNHYYARASVNGVTHLTMGGGGAPLYTPASGQPNIVVFSKSYSFGEFTINGNTLTAKIVNDSGATIDTFTITR